MLCVQMKTIIEPVLQKFLRPRHYARRIDVNWRSVYAYIEQGLLPAHKFAGVVLLDVEECDAILNGLTVPVVPVTAAKRKRQASKKATNAKKEARHAVT